MINVLICISLIICIIGFVIATIDYLKINKYIKEDLKKNK